jgi:hypothetical protein
MSTIRIVIETPLAPDRVLAAAHDFTERRERIFPAVSTKHLEVHELGETSADVTEATPVGLGENWERCEYDWSEPGSVKAPVKDSNVYEPAGSTWELRATPQDGGSRVEMVWVRVFRRSPRGITFGALFRTAGKRLFRGYAREVLENIECLEGEAASSSPERTTPRSDAGTSRAAPAR